MRFQYGIELIAHRFTIQAAVATDKAKQKEEQRTKPKKVNPAPEFLDTKGYAMSGCEFHSRAFQKEKNNPAQEASWVP